MVSDFGLSFLAVSMKEAAASRVRAKIDSQTNNFEEKNKNARSTPRIKFAEHNQTAAAFNSLKERASKQTTAIPQQYGRNSRSSIGDGGGGANQNMLRSKHSSVVWDRNMYLVNKIFPSDLKTLASFWHPVGFV